MRPTVGLLALFLAIEPSAALAQSRPYELETELGVARTLGTRPIFDYALCLGGSALRYVLPRLDVGIFVAYRQVVDTAAASFWYADIGARVRFLVVDRLSIRVDAGWSARHIGVESGYANTVGGLVAGAGLALPIYLGRNWRIGAVAAYHVTARTAERFWTQDLGVAVSSSWRL